MAKQEKALVFSDGRLLACEGRPPWFNAEGRPALETFVIGVTGGTASGKTTVATTIVESLDVPWVCILSMDSFYKVLNEEQLQRAKNNSFNFDSPEAFDISLMVETIRKLKAGQQVQVPIYNFTTHSRETKATTMYGASVLIVEGILSFATPELRALMDLMIFVSCDADVRLARRLQRDIEERGRDLKGALAQYNTFVKPAFDQFIRPTKKFADLVVPRGAANNVAMELILEHIQTILRERGTPTRRSTMLATRAGLDMPAGLTVMPATNQLRVLQTILRDDTTPRDEFVFHTHRLQRLLIEQAMSLLPHTPHEVSTHCGKPFKAQRFSGQLCGVSIIRAGLTMDVSLRAVVKDLALGKILIQTNEVTKDPELHFVDLPRHIKDSHVFLCDAVVATGAAALMAVRVLLDHGVKQENIFLVTIIASPAGVHNILYAFPHIKLITSAVDREVNDRFQVLPGIGKFGDRYFGTASKYAYVPVADSSEAGPDPTAAATPAPAPAVSVPSAPSPGAPTSPRTESV